MVALEPALQWGWNGILINKTNYLLEVLAWQNSYNEKKSAQWKANEPKPFEPEFMKKAVQAHKSENKAMDIDELKTLLDKPRGAV